jgi:hypothetical protein
VPARFPLLSTLDLGRPRSWAEGQASRSLAASRAAAPSSAEAIGGQLIDCRELDRDPNRSPIQVHTFGPGLTPEVRAGVCTQPGRGAGTTHR